MRYNHDEILKDIEQGEEIAQAFDLTDDELIYHPSDNFNPEINPPVKISPKFKSLMEVLGRPYEEVIGIRNLTNCIHRYAKGSRLYMIADDVNKISLQQTGRYIPCDDFFFRWS